MYASYCPRTGSSRIHKVIVLVSASHILVSNNTSLVIGTVTKSTILDDYKVSLLSDNPPFKLALQHLEASIYCRKVSWISVLHLSISI